MFAGAWIGVEFSDLKRFGFQNFETGAEPESENVTSVTILADLLLNLVGFFAFSSEIFHLAQRFPKWVPQNPRVP